MARIGSTKQKEGSKKKTSQGSGKFTKTYNKGGGSSGSITSKNYTKKRRGQGK